MELRRFLGIAGIGLTWGIAWALVFAILALIASVVDPDSIDPGEGPIFVFQIGLTVGFVSGVLFGVLLAWAENRKSVRDLSVMRAVLWGALGSAILPLATPMNDSVLLNTIPLGVISASATAAMARAASRGRSLPGPLGGLARVLHRAFQATMGNEACPA